MAHISDDDLARLEREIARERTLAKLALWFAKSHPAQFPGSGEAGVTNCGTRIWIGRGAAIVVRGERVASRGCESGEEKCVESA
jgi:hypothetical protein